MLRKTLSKYLNYRLKPLLYMHDLFLLEGTEKNSGLPLTILIAADSGMKDYIKRHGFGSKVTEQSLGEIPMWLTPKIIRPFFKTADLVIWWAHPTLERYWPRPKPLARLPTWTLLEIDLQSPESNKRGKEKFRRYRNATMKSGYRFEHTKRESDYIDFIQNMLIPYIRKRHGENANFQNVEGLLSDLQLEKKSLFLLKSEGRSIGGITLEFNGLMVRFVHIGIRTNFTIDISSTVSSALYYFMINEARERKCTTLNLGHCRPFVQDGVFEYKRVVGAHPAAARLDEAGSMELSIFRKSPGAIQFLSENPMVALEPDGRFALNVFTVGSSDEDIDRINKLKSRYCFNKTLELRAFDLSTHDNYCWYASNKNAT